MMDQAQKLRTLAAQHAEAQDAVVTNATGGARAGTRSRAVALASGKGGVGKSSISLALAIALGNAGKRVLLFDADLGLANVHILLGLTPRHTLEDVVRGERSLGDIICKGPGGIDIVPGASGVAMLANGNSRTLHTLEQSLGEYESVYDFICIDSGAGIAEQTIRMCTCADTAFLVVTPEPTSLADVYAMVKVLSARGVHKIHILANQCRSSREGEEIFGKLQALVHRYLHIDLDLLGVLPEEPAVRAAIRRQQSVLTMRPDCRFSHNITRIACALSGLPVPPLRPGFFSRMVHLFNPSGAESV